MTKSSRPEFEILDNQDKEYHRWVSDVTNTFIGKWLTTTIFPPPNGPLASDEAKAQALMFLRCHIHPTLKKQYLKREDHKDLWDVLKQLFKNVHDVLIPELTVRWESIRLMDFAKVEDYNQAMLDLQAELSFCGVDKTDKDMIENTLYTFTTSMSLLSHQYRLEYEQNRVTLFSDLICVLAKKERHQEIILNNKARLVRTKKIPESNQTSGGKAPRKTRNRKPAPYEREQNQPHGCCNGNNRRGNNRSNTWRRDDGNSAPHRNNNRGRGRQGKKSGQGQNPPSNSNQKRRSPCYICKSTTHLHHDCCASKESIDTYRRHKRYLAQEANFIGGDDIGAEPSTNFTIADFEAKKQAGLAHMDAVDFD